MKDAGSPDPGPSSTMGRSLLGILGVCRQTGAGFVEEAGSRSGTLLYRRHSTQSSASSAARVTGSACLEKGLAAGKWAEGLPPIGFVEGFSPREAKQNLAAGLCGHQHRSYRLRSTCRHFVQEQSVPKFTQQINTWCLLEGDGHP